MGETQGDTGGYICTHICTHTCTERERERGGGGGGEGKQSKFKDHKYKSGMPNILLQGIEMNKSLLSSPHHFVLLMLQLKLFQMTFFYGLTEMGEAY